MKFLHRKYVNSLGYNKSHGKKFFICIHCKNWATIDILNEGRRDYCKNATINYNGNNQHAAHKHLMAHSYNFTFRFI